MKIVAVTANPEPKSLTDAAGNALLDGAAEGGARTELIDLCAEGFNPVFGMEDRTHYLGQGPMPEDVQAMQERIKDADVLALVFPVYWYSMPAIMKGFIDRVICRGFAYNADGTPGALAGRRVELVMLTGGDKEWYQSSGIGEALDNQLRRQTFLKYCQVAQVETIYVDNLDSGNDEQQAREAADRHLVALALKGRQLAAGTEPEAGQDAQ
ncbi:NAD(P)H-dependent oxidoreductase [Bifidobacterium sp. 7101]|uniref:NAD(P)H-dependent oxidoreductase n=1 Tax=Bifidobacterium sp. 7101 TaxID=1394175 RepID=UPI00041753DC|nr:NAD(P)H-dependent oxidoreductase [Bifidobacterium sp. 7101]